MKLTCEYCGTISFVVGDNKKLVCSSCGAPSKDVMAFEPCPVYIMRVRERVSNEARAQIKRAWDEIFAGIGEPPRLIVLEMDIDIVPLQGMSAEQARRNEFVREVFQTKA